MNILEKNSLRRSETKPGRLRLRRRLGWGFSLYMNIRKELELLYTVKTPRVTT